MKRIEIESRDLYSLIKDNENMMSEFMDKPISDFTYDDFMYCIYYLGDNVFVTEVDDYDI